MSYLLLLYIFSLALQLWRALDLASEKVTCTSHSPLSPERERKCVCVCVCERERERERRAIWGKMNSCTTVPSILGDARKCRRVTAAITNGIRSDINRLRCRTINNFCLPFEYYAGRLIRLENRMYKEDCKSNREGEHFTETNKTKQLK